MISSLPSLVASDLLAAFAGGPVFPSLLMTSSIIGQPEIRRLAMESHCPSIEIIKSGGRWPQQPSSSNDGSHRLTKIVRTCCACVYMNNVHLWLFSKCSSSSCKKIKCSSFSCKKWFVQLNYDAYLVNPILQ